MSTNDYLFTSESVTEGHPDKIADAIADNVLDDCIRQDKYSRVACEVLVTTGLVVVAGEITTDGYVDVRKIVQDTVEDIGYNDSAIGFDYKSVGVISSLNRQSLDISQGVTKGQGLFKEQGSGDIGLMFGAASNETDEYMQCTGVFAHRLTKALSVARKSGLLSFLRPDGKAQVTVKYVDGKPISIDTVVVCTQHTPDIQYHILKEAIIEEIVKRELPLDMLADTKYFINPTGRFVVGGPMGDTGVTGRKIIVDTYSGAFRHGGGAFSGKDPSKVDRSAAYYCRYIAKNIVAAQIATKCEVQLAYAIGVAKPVSIFIDTFGTSKYDNSIIVKAVNEVFDARPANIIEDLNLLRPIYHHTTNYGHFGRCDCDDCNNIFTWERLDMVEQLKESIKILTK